MLSFKFMASLSLCSILLLVTIYLQVECWVTPKDIDSFIADFQQQIQDEKKASPLTLGYETTRKTMSINAAVERSSDIQRTFEYIAEKTNMLNLQGVELALLKQALQSSFSYQELVQKCEKIHPAPNCKEDSPYRTYDGTCNNLQNPTWGSLLYRHRRLFPQSYEGLSGFRQSVLGGPLPEARTLSLKLLPFANRTSSQFSNMFVFYGQLLSHDITDTPRVKVNGLLLPCCPYSGFDYPECQAIPVSEDDPFFSHYNRTCLQFVRSAPYSSCEFSKRKHMNSVPVFIDAHFTYGRTESEANELRMNDGSGRLVSQQSAHGDLMPPNMSEDELFCRIKDTSRCFKGGDSRTNQHAVLMSLQTVLLRDHNRMADELKKMNSHWNEEKIFQTARQILMAKMQCIAYKEYLPILLSKGLMDANRLWVGSSYQYDKSLDPTVSAEFTTTGFRIHSMTSTRIGNTGCAKLRLRDIYMDPSTVHQGCAADYLEGSCRRHSLIYGPWAVPDTSNYGIKFPSRVYGTDINALHIQRGRDNGMPSYPDIVKYLTEGNITISSFDDLGQVMLKKNADLLRTFYADVRDIDAYIGMQYEHLLPDSPLTRTTASIIAEHFRRLKYGDRFYFENRWHPGSFTQSQIESIKKASLSGIICDNTKDVKEMPHNALLLPSNENRMLSCENIVGVDLLHWKESQESK